MVLDYQARHWTDARDYLETLDPERKTVGARARRHVVLNLAAAFDIETTSFYYLGEKRACMYIWQFAIEGVCFYGRTWDEYDQFLALLTEVLGLSKKVKLRVFVHNLAFEFQFLRRRYEFDKVFAIKRLTPILASTGGIEYRCSYKLTNLSLAKAAEGIHIHTIRKQVGKLDYSLLRHSGTPLTQDELDYCCYDVLILNALIDQRRADEGGDLTKIPMTSTGYIRRMCRDACFTRKNYNNWIKRLRLTRKDYEVISQLRAGGFTHANELWSGRVMRDVESRDIASSYPTVCVTELFPMSPFEWHDGPMSEQDLENYRYKSWMARVEWSEGLINKTTADSAMSESKVNTVDGHELDNGRIRRADHVEAWITDVDWENFRMMYYWKPGSVIIHEIRVADRGRLPKEIVDVIRQLYYNKTKLKHSDPVLYQHSKELLNSIFGMMYTDPLREMITYDTYDAEADREGEPDWHVVKVGEQFRNLDEELEAHNNSRSRFVYYPWGVWVTAYARNRLFRVMSRIGEDYLYSDTDSVKIMHPEDYADIFDEENKLIDEKIKAACDYYGYPADAFAPSDEEDVPHPLGHWEFDGHYNAFKTLGAKRYMYKAKPRKDTKEAKEPGQFYHPDNDIYMTVAGCGKQGLARYLYDTGDPFGFFDDKLEVPPEFTQKLAHSYGDFEIEGELVDYMGNPGKYHEMSFVHMEPTGYTLGLDAQYAEFIKLGGYTEVMSDATL